MTKEQEIFKAEIEPLMDALYLACAKHDLNLLAFVHIPREGAPTATEGIGHLNDQVPPTMIKMYDLMKSREVIETQPLPVSS